MRILFLSNFYPPVVFGGYERLCFDVASEMQSLGHQVKVLTSSYGGEQEADVGHSVCRNLFLFATEGNIYEPFKCNEGERRRLSHENARTFEKIVIDFDPDVIFVWNLYFFDAELIDAVEASGRRCCYLLTDNWLIAQASPEFVEGYFRDRVFGRDVAGEMGARLPGRGKRLVGRAVFPSRFMRDLYAEAGFSFGGGEAICYHGVRLNQSVGASRVARDKFVVPGEVRLLFAGRVVEIKGVHTAVEAFRKIKDSVENGLRIRLTIVGDLTDQAYFERLSKTISREGLADDIVFEDSVKEDQLFQLFQSHDIYLFPSLYEPFSLTLILALWSGIPVVSSDAGGSPEIVFDGETGVLFPARNPEALAGAVIRLVNDAGLRKLVSVNAVSCSSKLTFQYMISMLEQQLNECTL